MKIVRWILVVAVWIGAGAAIDRWCVPQLRCNFVEHRSVAAVEPLTKTNAIDSPDLIAIAHREMRRVSDCLERCGPSVARYRLLGQYNRFLQNHDESIALYRRALELDQRPELYFEMGVALAESKRRDEAMQTILIAAKHEPRVLDHLTFYEGQVRDLLDDYSRELNARQVQQGVR